MAVAFAVALGAHLYYGKLSGPHSMSTGAGAATAPAALVREGDLAPDFTLPDAHGGKVTLSQLVEKGPVLIVYFMGYNCPRCVAHLTHLDERKPEFDAVAAQIVAMSPSTVTEYKDSIEQYGDFRFSLVADEAMSVARAYGLYDGESLNHGAIIVDRSRRVRFAAAGAHPYDDEEQLLKVLGDLRGK
jgi:peroxiredoxin